MTKVRGILDQSATHGLSPGQASKLYGITNFLELGMFGRVGQAGLNPIKERMHESTWEVTPRLTTSFAFLDDIFKLKPMRDYTLFEADTHRVLMASDAYYENSVGKAGFSSSPTPANHVRNGLGW